MRKPLRLGVLGAGRWGRTYIRTIAQIPELRVARVASRNPDTQALVPPDCAVSADWRDVVRADDIDGVVVAAPPAVHAEMTLEAIACGRPVMVEKPLALSTASAVSILAAAEARRVFVLVDHVHLFHPGYQALKRSALSNGPVRAIAARAGARGPYRPDVRALWDWGPHDVAMCIDLLGGEPQTVDAECLECRPVDAGWGERLRLRLRFPADVEAEIELSTLRERHRSFEVRLDSGILRYDGSPPLAAADLPLTRAVREFATSINNGAASLASLKLGVGVVRTLARCEAAVAQKA